MNNPEGARMAELFVKAPLPMTTEVVASGSELIGNVTLSISENPLGVGGGKASAEIKSYNEARELAKSLVSHLAPIEKGSSTGCGDGRELVKTNTGEDQVVSPKLFGGSVNAAAGMQVISGSELPGKPYEKIFKTIADTLTAADRRLGAHIDTHAHGEASHCGSLDGAQKIYAAAGSNGDALQPLVKYFTEKLGFNFDVNEYAQQVRRSAEFAASSSFETWNGAKGINETIARGGLVRTLEGGDHDDPAHGHKENLITVILREGVSLRKEDFISANKGKQTFVVTFPQLIKKAEIMTVNPDPAEASLEVARKVQAGILFQLAHALVVPDGTQYLTVIE
ncbi:hypothetical protein EBZ38_04630 [bacterium]|nr:hypothetical protein [bacterium]NBX97964.1 hypothetical protein [bacterium]NDC94414.1 hypothetical protein [bacterium]NDD83554.1 hypothetical protein [bacterium]